MPSLQLSYVRHSHSTLLMKYIFQTGSRSRFVLNPLLVVSFRQIQLPAPLHGKIPGMTLVICSNLIKTMV
jgi:hypothetical protein